MYSKSYLFLKKIIESRLYGKTTSLINYRYKINHSFDSSSPEYITTKQICELVNEMVPTAYGQFKLVAPKDSKKDKEIQCNLPFKEELANLVEITRKSFKPKLKYNYKVTDFIDDNKFLIEKLPGTSTANIFLIKDKVTNKQVVRKLGLRFGIEGNGIPKLTGEINYYLELLKSTRFKHLKPLYPNLLNYKVLEDCVTAVYKYIDNGKNTAESLADGTLNINDFPNLLNNLFDNLDIHINLEYKMLEKSDSFKKLSSLYLSRATVRSNSINYIDTIKSDLKNEDVSKVKDLLLAETIKINNKTYKNPIKILESIKKQPKLLDILRPRVECPCIHGDLTFQNTVFDSKLNKIFLVDPRGSTIGWDPLYDFGKLKFSLAGFTDIVLNSVEIITKGNEFEINFLDNIYKNRKNIDIASNNFINYIKSHNISKTFDKFEPFWEDRILFSSAIHFLADIPYRLYTENSVKSAVACYLLGIIYLNEVFEKIDVNYTRIFKDTSFTDVPIKLLQNIELSNKIILIDGPAASGKTSLAYKVSEYISKLGYKPTVLKKDLFIRPRNIRDEIVKKYKQNPNDISVYSSLAWNLDSYHKTLQELITKTKGSDSSEFYDFEIKNTYNRLTGNLDLTETLRVYKNGVIIVEGSESLDDVTEKYADISMFLSVSDIDILLDRVLLRELEKPESLRIDNEHLSQRFNIIDRPHAEFLINKSTKLKYNFIIDTSVFAKTEVYTIELL